MPIIIALLNEHHIIWFQGATSNFTGYVAPLWPWSQMMPKQPLNDRTLKALKPAHAGCRYEKRDSVVPGLLVRVTETGKRTFMLQTRSPAALSQPGEHSESTGLSRSIKPVRKPEIGSSLSAGASTQRSLKRRPGKPRYGSR